ncbi:MAG: Ig-like domain-containing protein, partial [Hormoscilla sp.]
TPGFGFTGTDSFSYTVADSQGLTASAFVTVDVTGTTNQPPIAIDDFAETTEGTAVSISVLDNDFDPEGNLLSITGFTTSTVSGGTLSISGNSLVYQSQFGFIGTESFNYTISDGQGGTDTATVSVTTVARNGSISGETFADGNANGIKDEGESGLATVAVFLDTNNNGSFDVGEPDALTSSTGGYFFPNLLPDTYNVRQVEEPGFQLTSANPVTVTLVQGEDRTGVNFGNLGGPVSSDIIAGDDFATTDAGSSVAVAVLANDVDIEGDALTIIGFEQFTFNGGVVSTETNGTPFDLTDDLLVYSPPGGFIGTDSFSYTVSDQKSNETATVTVNVVASTVVNQNVVGMASDDNLVAGAGNDSLTGGLGNDILTGGAGSDRFIFNSPNEGVDTIADFDEFGGDAIGVSAVGFGAGLIPGTLDFTQFTLGTSATTPDQRFIYGINDGSLFFDADGTGAIGQVQIATLSGVPTGFSASNIIVF